MASYNRIIFAGHLTSDPMGKLVGKDMACRFTLAYNARWKDKEGKDVEEVCFVDIETWRTNADIAMKYLKKGHLVLVEGRLKQAKWIKDGVEKSKHVIACDKIVLLEAMEKKTAMPTNEIDKSIPDKSVTDKSVTIDDLPF